MIVHTESFVLSIWAFLAVTVPLGLFTSYAIWKYISIRGKHSLFQSGVSPAWTRQQQEDRV